MRMQQCKARSRVDQTGIPPVGDTRRRAALQNVYRKAYKQKSKQKRKERKKKGQSVAPKPSWPPPVIDEDMASQNQGAYVALVYDSPLSGRTSRPKPSTSPCSAAPNSPLPPETASAGALASHFKETVEKEPVSGRLNGTHRFGLSMERLCPAAPGSPPWGSPVEAANAGALARQEQVKVKEEADCEEQQTPDVVNPSAASLTASAIQEPLVEVPATASHQCQASLVGQEGRAVQAVPEMVSQGCQTDVIGFRGEFVSRTEESLMHEIYALRTRFRCNIPAHLLHLY